jgi:hypothetical protein
MEFRMILKRVLLCASVLLMLASVAVAQDVAKEATKDQVSCYTTWDDAYLYLAFKVDSPDVRATHSKPNMDLTGDDTVEFYIETDNKHSMKISPACFAMTVSASGGSQFRAGADSGVLQPTPAFTFKYGTTVQGTVNNPDDIDMGYNVEMAVPWNLLHATPPSLGDMMSFNVIVRRHGGSASFVSLSPRVTSEQDALVPAKWVNLVFTAHTFGAATTSVEKILSAKYVVRSPLIDGVVNDREWHQNTSFALDLPMPPGFVYEAKFPIQRTVLARYTYWYQGDARKQAPVEHVGSKELADVPVKGVGPWFSYDRVQWHKEELSSMVAAGVGIALPDYLAASRDARGPADKGLDCMVSALDELRKEGKPYPMVGMYLDASYLEASGQPVTVQALYGAIKDFFDRVPPEYRAFAPAAKPNSGQPGAIVCMAHAKSQAAWVPALFTGCAERFAKDFGRPLIWIGDTTFAPIAAGFDAVAGSPSSRISLATIICDESYDTQWNDVIAANPLWVLCDAWNDYSTGKCMGATGKLGTHRFDSTKAHIRRFIVDRDYSARFLRFDVPKVISSKQIAQAQVTIRNTGNSTWRALDGYALGYRWYRNGRFFGESRVRRPLETDVSPGDTVAVNVGIATVTSLGTALPEGPCELRLELIRISDNKWFSALGDMPLMAPITIGPPPEFDATILSCAAPNMLAAGATYPITVKIRNDGSLPLRAGTAKIECRLFKVPRDNPEGPAVEVPISPLRKTLAKDCKPGEITDVPMDLVIAPPGKNALDLSKLEDPWSYQLRFDVVSGPKRLSETGAPGLNRAVELLDVDYGPRIVDSDVPATLTPGQSFEAKIVLRNNGVKPWDAKRSKIGYHWYSADGTELDWEGITTPLKTTVGPAWPAVLKAKLQAPAQEGKYTLVWDMMVDNTWLSTDPLSRGGDILPVQVEVTKDAGDASASKPVATN